MIFNAIRGSKYGHDVRKDRLVPSHQIAGEEGGAETVDHFFSFEQRHEMVSE